MMEALLQKKQTKNSANSITDDSKSRTESCKQTAPKLPMMLMSSENDKNTVFLSSEVDEPLNQKDSLPNKLSKGSLHATPQAVTNSLDLKS